MQSLDNARDVMICRNCLGFVGDVISQLEFLSGLPRHECVERHKRRHPPACEAKTSGLGHLSGLIECLEGCGEVYCSESCRSDHWGRGHHLLCVGPVPEEGARDHPLVAFRIHAMQTNEIFLLVGEVMAQIATAFCRGQPTKVGDDGDESAITNGGSSDKDGGLAAARALFADFVQEPWWNVVVAAHDRRHEPETGDAVGAGAGGVKGSGATCAADGVAAVSLPDTLRSLCEESSALLRNAFSLALGPPLPAPLELALSADAFGRVVGMFEQNNVGIRAPSPIPDILRELLSDGGGVDVDHADDKRRRRRELLRKAAGLVGQILEAEGCSDPGSDEDEDLGSFSKGCSGQGSAMEGYCDGHGPCASAAVAAAAPFGRADDREGFTGEARNSGGLAAARRAGVDSADDEDQELKDSLALLSSVVGGDAGDREEEDSGAAVFAPLDGTALYSLVCCMNHSCRPNCVVRYPGRRPLPPTSLPPLSSRGTGGPARADPLVAEVVLLRDVCAGDELTQSYVTREIGVAERRKALQDYGFYCRCPRCLEEEEAPPLGLLASAR